MKIHKDNGIEYYYPLEILRKKSTIIPFSNVQKIKFNGYAYNSPSHFRLKTGNQRFRFNCPEDEANKLIDFFNNKDLEVEYIDENKVGFR